MSYLFPLALCAALLAHPLPASRVSPASQAAETSGTSQEAEVSGETALQVAKRRAARKYKPLDRYNIVLCDLGITWRVIFELKDPRSDGTGPEYTVSKRDGDIIHTEVAAHRRPTRSRGKASGTQAAKGLSREEALALAKEYALKTYGPIADLGVGACELIDTWYIAFYFKDPLMRGGAPLYIIDKKTGEVIEDRFYT